MSSSQSRPVRTRIAPSPTGEIHVGTMATVLKNYAFAKKHGGQFVVRIEDTDKEREVPGAIERIKKDIRDYGLMWDEGPEVEGPYGPYVQSERLELYTQHALELVEKKEAYYCFCSKERLEKIREEQRAAKTAPKYDRHCLSLSDDEVAQKLADGQSWVIRLRVPDDQQVSFTDMIRGEITFHSSEVDDQVLIKSDGYPTYHLAVIVDDHLMRISHIMRGEEWISSTPKHVLLYQAFGWEQPIYVHIPVFLNPDGKGKMSKRKGTVSARSFLDDGFLPEAMLNFFMISGWAAHDQREMLSLEEYIQEFDPADLSPKSVAFDRDKLRWLNGQYIRQLSRAELTERLQPFLPDDFPAEPEVVDEILELVFERLEVLADIEELTSFFYRPIEHEAKTLLKKADAELVAEQLELVSSALESVQGWTVAEIEKTIRELQAKHEWHKRQFFMMIRHAVTGKTATPPLFETIKVIGQAETIQRLAQAKQLIF